MRRQNSLMMQPTLEGLDETEMMLDDLVEQAKAEDALFIKVGITNDEL